jgi:glutathione synthase/RimK-type ligase-like ATP-grasp enzyme
MTICYARTSKPSALRLRETGNIVITRSSYGDVNWGRARANTRLNPNIGNSTNKRVMRSLFKEHGVPSPTLYTYPDIQFPCVGRPDRHTGGRGFWLCRTPSDIRKALRGTRRKKAATHFVEYINKSRAPREYRVHVFNGKSIRISEKLFGSSGATSHGCYTTVKPTHNVKHVRAAAKKAMKATGLDFGAVDVLANDTECWVTEVNAAPGIGGSMPRVYADAFRTWLAE